MEMLFEQTDYREYLRHELVRRVQHNASYSQRAFARDIGVPANRLSEIFGGKQGLSRNAAQGITRKLGFNQSEESYFLDLVDAMHARSAEAKTAATERVQKRRKSPAISTLDQERFKLIADWYHLAILELLRLANGPLSETDLAKSLGLKLSLVNDAIIRLENLNLVTVDIQGVSGTGESLFAGGSAPSAAVRTFHEQIIAKASSALHQQSVDTREMQSAFVPMRQDKFIAYQKRLRQLFNEFCDESDNESNADAVYAVSLQYFKIGDVPKNTNGQNK